MEEQKIMLADGLEDAFIGIVESSYTEPRACYSIQKIFKILMNEGMSEEEAEDYFYYNIISANIDEQTPMFLDDIPLEEILINE